jgi:hypothetical protein
LIFCGTAAFLFFVVFSVCQTNSVYHKSHRERIQKHIFFCFGAGCPSGRSRTLDTEKPEALAIDRTAKASGISEKNGCCSFYEKAAISEMLHLFPLMYHSLR